MKFWKDFRNIVHSQVFAFEIIKNDLIRYNVIQYSEQHVINLQSQRKFSMDMFLYVIMMKMKCDSPQDTRRILLNRLKHYTEYFSELIPQMMELCKMFVLNKSA